MGTKLSMGVFHVALLAPSPRPQVSMVCIAYCQDRSIYTPNIILGSVFHVVSQLICIFTEFFLFKYLRNFHGVLCDTPNKNKGLKFDHSTTHQYSTMSFFS